MAFLIKLLSELRNNKTFISALLFISFALGLFAFYSSNTLTVICSFLLFASSILIVGAFVFKIRKLFSYWFIFAFCLVFFFGMLNARIHNVYNDDLSFISYAKNIELEGVVSSIPNFNSSNSTYKFTFSPYKVVIKGKKSPVSNTRVLGVIKNESNKPLNIKFGDKISLHGNLTTPFASTNPSQFDYNKFLLRKGILKTFYSLDSDFLFISSPKFSDIAHKKGFLSKINQFSICLLRKMNDVRDTAIQKHSKYIQSPRLEILGGVVFGDDAVNPPDDVKGSFINSGLLHLLAASGLNVALILSLWLCLIYFINISYKLKILSGIFIVFLYTLMTGFPPSIVRASVMLILMLFGKLLYRKADGISLIFMAGFLILIFKPQFITDVGFQLSFLVTFGLIVCMPCVVKILEVKNKNYLARIKYFPKLIKSILLMFSPTSFVCCFLVPFVAQLWAAPLQAFYFNTFSLYSVFANIAVIPFIGIVSFLGFLSTAFCFVPLISDLILRPIDFILNFIIQIILNISNFFSSLSNSLIIVPSPSVLNIFLFYVFVLLFFISLKHLFKRKVINLILVFVFTLFLLFFVKFSDDSSEVIFFNVSNADNILIKTSKYKYIMIDTGRSVFTGNSTAKTITLEYMRDNNIKEIDTLIVTHYDSDHSGGLIDILNEVKVKNLIIPKPECNSKNSCEIKQYIENNNVNYILPYSGQTFNFEPNIKLTNFVPCTKTSSKDSRNDSSTVSLVELGDFKFLFMADISTDAFDSIKDLIPSDIDVLKSAHHGAKNTVNRAMLDKLSPEFSILSTGINPYGHPDKETKKLLTEYSVVLSTKDEGAIKFIIKDKIKVYGFDGKKGKFRELFREI